MTTAVKRLFVGLNLPQDLGLGGLMKRDGWMGGRVDGWGRRELSI